ncbi:MAG: exodeoxyribonuclease III [Candidatus Bathyarchaeota archaeon]
MRVISWNINSVRARLPRLLTVLRRHKPDVVCIQETKASNGGFPVMQLSAAGYNIVLHGQPSYNGVAILVRDHTRRCNLWAFDADDPHREVIGVASGPGLPTDVQRGFPGDPVPNEARVVSTCVGKLRLVNVYVVNGKARESDQFKLKQYWMAAMGKWLQSLSKTPSLLVVGDFNVAPDDRDVWDPEGLRDRIHCTEEERSWLKEMQGNRLRDLLRVTTEKPGIYTWWPYKKDAFNRNEGLRFDLALGDDRVVDMVERVWVDREERRPVGRMGKPSDHAPVIIDLDAP